LNLNTQAASNARELDAAEEACRSTKVGRCRLTVSKPVLKPHTVSRLKVEYHYLLSIVAFKFNLRRYTKAGAEAAAAAAAQALSRAVAAGESAAGISGEALRQSRSSATAAAAAAAATLSRAGSAAAAEMHAAGPAR